LRTVAQARPVVTPDGWEVRFPPTALAVFVTDVEFAALFTTDDGDPDAPDRAGNGPSAPERVPGAMWGPGRESAPPTGNSGGCG
jgi:hypothetical protein